MNGNKTCPCKGCVAPKRHSGCHATCVDYTEWNTAHRKELDAIIKARRENDCFPNSMIKNKKGKMV